MSVGNAACSSPAVGEGFASPIPDRIEALRKRLAETEIGALLVSCRENVRYLSGFSGSSGALLISQEEAVLVTDSRYGEQAFAEASGFRLEVAAGPPPRSAASMMRSGRLGFEAEALSYGLWEGIRNARNREDDGFLVPCRGWVEALRIRKDPEEIALIRKAVQIASAAFDETLPRVHPGVQEREIAHEIECRMRRAGAEAVAFDLIVASGPRSSLPHGRPSDRRVGPGEFVVLDIGARYRGYHSDMTRTVFTGRPDSKAREVYSMVLQAQRAGIEAIRPGVRGRDVDRAARDVIEGAGHGGRFGHGTGHGVGLQIHESPSIGPRSDVELAPGMVFTVEPGVYLPGYGGVRIEDTVLVTQDGSMPLTHTSKDDWIRE